MLLAPDQSLAFLIAALLITVTPGPDILMTLSFGAARGRKSGMAFGLGCAMGCLNHTVLAAIGVSALIAASIWAFMALKLLGGGYLIWLGLRALKNQTGSLQMPSGLSNQPDSGTALFLKGLLANAINPKVVLFFLSFLPQFVDSTRNDIAWQTLQLGLLFSLQAALVFGVLGYFSGWTGQRLMRSPQIARWLDRVAGTVFIALGVRLILSRT